MAFIATEARDKAITAGLKNNGGVWGALGFGERQSAEDKRREAYQGAKDAFGYNQRVLDSAGGIYRHQGRADDLLRLANSGTAADRQLVSGLQNMAAGRGPSIAQNMLMSSNRQNALLQQGLANSGSGQDAQANALNAARNNAQARGSLNSQLASARIQEQQGAMQQLGGVLANQAQSRNQLLGMEMQQALASATNDLQREQIRQQYINAMANSQFQDDKSLLETGLGAFSGVAGGLGALGVGGK